MDNLIIAFWLLDVLDFSFMQMFDTTYPINGTAWFFIFLVMLIID